MKGCEKFQVIVSTERDQAEEGNSAWMLSVQVKLSGSPLEIRGAVEDCRVTSDSSENISISSIGLADCSTLVYSVKSLSPLEDLESLNLSVIVTPLYHPTVSTMYKLDSNLADLVGRKVLAHPKYALTMIHGHAREHQLYHQRTIKCDQVLYNIFEKESIPLATLWKEVCRKIKKVEKSLILVSHQMSTPEKYSISEIPVAVDSQYRIYPESWKSEINKGSKSLLKTQSFLPISKDKRKSFKRNKSLGA